MSDELTGNRLIVNEWIYKKFLEKQNIDDIKYDVQQAYLKPEKMTANHFTFALRELDLRMDRKDFIRFLVDLESNYSHIKPPIGV